MDLDALISEICSRVQERVAACENGVPVAVSAAAEDKPVLGILAEDHGNICHPTLESKELAEYYSMKCALLEDSWDVENWEGAIAYTLSNEALGKIVNGIYDSNFTRAFGKALLAGKKIFVPEEAVELFQYKETAPKAYYAKLEGNLDFLKECGVVILPNDQLISEILGTEPKTDCTQDACEEAETCCQVKEEKVVSHTRKVLSERDLVIANTDRVTKIRVTKKSIVTDLAKDYAKKYHIVIETVDCL